MPDHSLELFLQLAKRGLNPLAASPDQRMQADTRAAPEKEEEKDQRRQ